MQTRFLDVARGGTSDRTPVWFMRQAGRCLPEYRELRESHSLLEICHTPDLAVEVTLQPVRRFGVDVAILFSDIMVPLQAMGIDLDIVEGKGPVIAQPLRTTADLERLRPLDPPDDVPFVLETIKLLTDSLEVPLIGFSGAPFTLACYLVQGGPSKDFALTKQLMYSDPRTWERLMDRLSDAVAGYLRAQIGAGASAVQIFDSWVGSLSPADFRTYVRPWIVKIVKELEGAVPVILFGVGTGELLDQFDVCGADVIGVDWRVPLDSARNRVSDERVLQGNLDPISCLGPWELVEERALDVLRRGGGSKHIFNLGHGVHPMTEPSTLSRLVELVHSWDGDD